MTKEKFDTLFISHYENVNARYKNHNFKNDWLHCMGIWYEYVVLNKKYEDFQENKIEGMFLVGVRNRLINLKESDVSRKKTERLYSKCVKTNQYNKKIDEVYMFVVNKLTSELNPIEKEIFYLYFEHKLDEYAINKKLKVGVKFIQSTIDVINSKLLQIICSNS